jgi:hypothetical protein
MDISIIVVGAGISGLEMAMTIVAIERIHYQKQEVVAPPAENIYILTAEHRTARLPLSAIAIIEEAVLVGESPCSKKQWYPRSVAGPRSGPAICRFCELRNSLHPP